MSVDTLVRISSSVSHKDYIRLLEVLKHYSISPQNIERVRNTYKIICNEKCYCLKKERREDTKAFKSMVLVNYLKENGFDNVVQYINTDDNRQCIKYKKSMFYLTEWIEGCQCDFSNIDEVKKVAALMAGFHVKSRGFSDRRVKIPYKFKNWPLKLNRYKDELMLYKELIDRKKIKTSFDIRYYEVIDSFKSKMDNAIDLIKQSNYVNVIQDAKARKSVCYDCFNYNNIMAGESGKLFLIDMANIKYDLCVSDLAKFIRKILYKKEYGWDFQIAKEIIDSYCRINPLSVDEYKVLLALIIYPSKFRRLGRRRYKSKKNWNEDKYIRKLDRLIACSEKTPEFIDGFLQYYTPPAEI